MYVLIHLGNMNNSEREYKGREKKCWEISTICFNVDGTGGYYAEGSKSIGEGQTVYVLIHLGNINNSERE